MMDYHFSWHQDGKLSGKGSADFELAHVHIMARHSDRSPVYTYVIGSPVYYDCGLEDNGDGSQWTRLKDFPSPRKIDFDGETTYNTLFPIFPGARSKRCGMGKLTRTGFYQHKALGLQMWRKYSTALHLHNATDEVVVRSTFVQSTDTTRTMQSAAAFMLGFLPDRQSLRKQILIHVLPGVTLEAPPPWIRPVFPSCRHYWSFHKAQLKKTRYFDTERTKYHILFEQLSHMFNLNIDNLPLITKVFDSVRTRGCHLTNDPLPCYQGKCMDYDFANKLFEFMDWAFANDCTTNASIVGSLPFLRHSLLPLMAEVVRGREDAKRFVLSVGHDNTMTNLLKALGVSLDGQMPYASRISFELWRRKSAKSLVFYVRVLFNGSPITHRLAPWKAVLSASLPSELLAFSEFERYLTTGPFNDIKSYTKACRNL